MASDLIRTLNAVSKSLHHAGVLSENDVECCGEDLGMFAQTFEANVLSNISVPAPQAMWNYTAGSVNYVTGSGRLTISADRSELTFVVSSGDKRFQERSILTLQFEVQEGEIGPGRIFEFEPEAFFTRPDRAMLLWRVVRDAGLTPLLSDEATSMFVGMDQVMQMIMSAHTRAAEVASKVGRRRLAVLGDEPGGLVFTQDDFAPVSAEA